MSTMHPTHNLSRHTNEHDAAYHDYNRWIAAHAGQMWLVTPERAYLAGRYDARQAAPTSGVQTPAVTAATVRAMHRHDRSPVHSSLHYWDGYNGALEDVARLLEKDDIGVERSGNGS